MRRTLAALYLITGLVLPGVTSQAQVTSITATTFAGSLNGDLYTGTHSDFATFSNLAGTSTVFNDPAFTPVLSTSQAIGYSSQNGFSVTFASPVSNPIIDVFSLVNTLDFGTPVTILSNGGVPGSSQVALQLTSNGNGIIGEAINNGFDAGGTIELMGTFTTITATATTSSSDGSAILFVTPAAVPEPGSVALLIGIGVSGTSVFLRRRRR